jgi:hypothetical protein
VTAVVPVFGSAETLTALRDRLIPVLERCSEAFEIILVVGCGADAVVEHERGVAQGKRVALDAHAARSVAGVCA